MVIEIHGREAILGMRRAGKVAAETLAHVGALLRPGMSTGDIDQLVREDTKRRGGKPSQLGYHGFPGAVCTSRNQVVCHGIPSKSERLEEGDIVNVDVTTMIGGYHGDCSRTFTIGKVSPEALYLVGVAEQARDVGIAAVRAGLRLGDLGEVIESFARKQGCSVVRDFGGHGIGRSMHLPPHISHVGSPGTGMRLRAGMTITIEPMVNLGRAEVEILEDDWTVVTADGSLSAQFEHTLLVTETGSEILTLPPALAGPAATSESRMNPPRWASVPSSSAPRASGSRRRSGSEPRSRFLPRTG